MSCFEIVNGIIQLDFTDDSGLIFQEQWEAFLFESRVLMRQFKKVDESFYKSFITFEFTIEDNHALVDVAEWFEKVRCHINKISPDRRPQLSARMVSRTSWNETSSDQHPSVQTILIQGETISVRSFGPKDYRILERNLDEIGTGWISINDLLAVKSISYSDVV